ncbi:MAG: redoxin domain-containing protein [bacterium]|nr:redoxin domain-containing protein [bacterium]MBK8127830.1 redoxin domain-containing protein [bacterium]
MTTRRWLAPLFALLLTCGSAFAFTVGTEAPDFTLTDSWGNSHTLSDYRGNVVVLMFFGHT